jgi:hypothetical protein
VRRNAASAATASQAGAGPGTARPPTRAGRNGSALITGQRRGTVRSALIEIAVKPLAATHYARLFLSPNSPVPASVMIRSIDDTARAAVTTVVRRGWLSSDLAEVTSRRLSASHLPSLAALLSAEADRHPAARVATAWRDDLAGLGLASAVNSWTATGLELLLGLLAVFRTLPQIPTLLTRLEIRQQVSSDVA